MGFEGRSAPHRRDGNGRRHRCIQGTLLECPQRRVGDLCAGRTLPRAHRKIARDAFNEALKQPDIIRRFRDNGCEPLGTTPAAAATFVRTESERWGMVIKAAGIKAE